MSDIILRPEVYGFAKTMEEQLRANENKGGWSNCTNQFLSRQLDKNIAKLYKCTSHEEFRRRCANIANFAMMLADNDMREENETWGKIPDGS
ncbi:hypothetical protein EJP82_01060 [Paenibacillus anaericanus]|uniref:dATP/dGTP diphosphohydrolase N-terminal domain-containing protein n=1 Tax=Paenibacillus anaericanus TaxID=170367 RepID=A0A433YFE4_9BACL|nr:hypothetical protein [Paenibacillus anaericanus]RUT48563.1 hypothetical protein EJP82_01060 [Paenibacillus anaericanus]